VVSLGTVNVSSSSTKDEDSGVKSSAPEKKGPPRVWTPKDFYEGTKLVCGYNKSAHFCSVAMSVHLEDSCVCVHQHVLQGACSRALRVWKRAQYLTSVFVCQKRFCIHVCVAHASGSRHT